MEDFRNKLKSNQMNDNFDDWNDEEIWVKIESRLPEKRKRRLFFWFFGGFMMLSFAATLSYLHNEADIIITQVDPVEENVLLHGDVANRTNKEVSALISVNHNTVISNKSYDESPQIEQELVAQNEITVADLTNGLNVPKVAASAETMIEEKMSKANAAIVSNVKEVRQKGMAHVKAEELLPILKAQIESNNALAVELDLSEATSKVESSKQNKRNVLSENIEYPLLNTRPSLIRYEQSVRPQKMPISSSLLLLSQIATDVGKVSLRANRENYPLIFSVGGGLGTFTKRITPAQQEVQNLSEFRERLETPQESFFIKFRLEKQLVKWGLGVYGGLTYNQYNERIFHQYASSTEREIFTDMAFYISQVDGPRFFIPGVRIQRTNISGEINKYNETRVVKLPLGLTLQQDIGQLTIGVHLGTALVVYNKANGDIVQLNNKTIDKANFGAVDAYPLRFYGIQTGLRTNYSLFRKVGLYASLNYDMDRLNINGENSMRETFRMVNLGFGLAIDLD